MMGFLDITDPSWTRCTDNWEGRGVEAVLFGDPSGLKFSCSFNKGDFSAYIGVENSFEWEYLGEKCVEL
jgi:hypothetical protein